MSVFEYSDFEANDLDALLKFQVPLGWDGMDVDFTRYLQKNFAQPRKCTEAGVLVGVGALIAFADSAWLGHIIVDAPQYGRGIGRGLTEDLLALVEARGINRTVLSASEDGRLLYRKLDFLDDGTYACIAVNPNNHRTHHHNLKIRPATPTDRPQLLALDQRASGDDRRALWTGSLKGVTVVDGLDGLQGVYHPSIGDGIVLARDEETGLGLLTEKLRREPKTERVVVPETNRAAIEYLTGSGATRQTDQYRMLRGPGRRWQPDMIFARAGGYLG